mmetsp:Transcript_28786/g.75834  ORF Transcript_28786/g.75834 Transcript_28786/m.75834 type:complete len:819 (-) Transcript_28786:177-2633(-)
MASGPDDELLLRLLGEHADGDGRWSAIEESYNCSSTEKRSRRWLKNRAKKIVSPPSPLREAIVRVAKPNAQSGRVPASTPVITYDDFKKVVEETREETHINVEVENLYHKCKHLPREELPEVVRFLLGTRQMQAIDAGSNILVLGVNTPMWIANCMTRGPSEFEFHTTTLDESCLLHLFPMLRMQSRKTGSQTVVQDAVTPALVSGDRFAENLGQAMRWLEENTERDLKVHEIIPRGLLRVSCEACCAPPRLAVPEFIHSMERRLGIDARSEIIAVPHSKDTIYMANSANAMGCNALGDFIDAVDAGGERSGNNSFLYPVPFRVRSIDTSGLPASLLLAQGKTPVRWELYPFFGQNALCGQTSSTAFCAPAVDDVVRYPVPRSEAQADAYVKFVTQQAGLKGKKKNKSSQPHVAIRCMPVNCRLQYMRQGHMPGWLANGEDEPLALQLGVCAECFVPLTKDEADGGRGLQTVALPTDTLVRFAAQVKLCTCGQVRYCSEACWQKHQEIHANVCGNSRLGEELAARAQRQKRRAVQQNMTEQVRNINIPLDLNSVTSWEKYCSSRGFSVTDLRDVSLMFSMPLTILFGMTKFEGLGMLQLAGRDTLRIDVAGASNLETMSVEMEAFAELARAFPGSKIHLRLVGPELQVDQEVGLGSCGTDNLCVSSHKFLYQDFLASQQGSKDAHLPDIVVAPNAGIRESWYPAIQRVCELSLPLMFTGYDLADTFAGLQDLFREMPSLPRVVRDGRNPFAGSMPFAMASNSKTENDVLADAQLGETEVGVVLRATHMTSSDERIVTEMLGHHCFRVNSHYVLIHGYE